MSAECASAAVQSLHTHDPHFLTSLHRLSYWKSQPYHNQWTQSHEFSLMFSLSECVSCVELKVNTMLPTLVPIIVLILLPTLVALRQFLLLDNAG